MNQVSKEGALLPDTSTNTFMAEWTQKAELWKMVISIMMHLWIVFFFFKVIISFQTHMEVDDDDDDDDTHH